MRRANARSFSTTAQLPCSTGEFGQSTGQADEFHTFGEPPRAPWTLRIVSVYRRHQARRSPGVVPGVRPRSLTPIRVSVTVDNSGVGTYAPAINSVDL